MLRIIVQAGVHVLGRHRAFEAEGWQHGVSDFGVMERFASTSEKLLRFTTYLVALRVACHRLPSVCLLNEPVETLELSNAAILA